MCVCVCVCVCVCCSSSGPLLPVRMKLSAFVAAVLAACVVARAPPGLEQHPKPRTLADAKLLHRRATVVTQKKLNQRRLRSEVSVNGRVGGGGAESGVSTGGLSSSLSPGLFQPVASRLLSSLNPVTFGADPTGRKDSTEAFELLCAQLFNASALAPRDMASGIVDFGGATLDLNGGEYLISAPIVVPVFAGNMRITGGTLRASKSFPPDRFLIEVGSASCKPKDAQNVCNEFIAIHDIFLDAAHVASGGVIIYHTMGTTVGPSAFVTGFNVAGIHAEQGHETIVSESWLGEYYWSDNKQNATASCVPDGTGKNGSTAVVFNGEDNYMNNVIIFDFACLGVLVNGAATTLDGVHSWNGGGVAISVNGAYDIQDRIVNCYLDYSVLQILNPKFVLCQGNFFYNSHTVLVGDALEGFVMRENIYSMNDFGGNESIVLQPSAGQSRSGEKFSPSCHSVVVEDEIDAEQDSRAHFVYETSARKSLYQSNATQWVFDFSAELLLPRIDHISYSLVLDEGERNDCLWRIFEFCLKCLLRYVKSHG